MCWQYFILYCVANSVIKIMVIGALELMETIHTLNKQLPSDPKICVSHCSHKTWLWKLMDDRLWLYLPIAELLFQLGCQTLYIVILFRGKQPMSRAHYSICVESANVRIQIEALHGGLQVIYSPGHSFRRNKKGPKSTCPLLAKLCAMPHDSTHQRKPLEASSSLSAARGENTLFVSLPLTCFVHSACAGSFRQV